MLLTLKCLSLNVRALNKSIKADPFFLSPVTQTETCFFFLQEAYFSKELEIIWENEWGGKAFFSHGTKLSKGVSTLINPYVDLKIEKFIPDKHGRFVFLKIALEEKPFVLVNIYAPNDVTQQTAFFTKLSKHLEEFAHDPIITGGDFNYKLTMHDENGGNPITNKLSLINEISALCHVHCLNDIWRHLNSEKECFTWRNNSFKIRCGLDYFLISSELTTFKEKCEIFCSLESDHSAVSIHLHFKYFKQRKGTGFWKFNTALLGDALYVIALKPNLPVYKEKKKDDLS